MELAAFRSQVGLVEPCIPTVEAIYATGHALFEREQYADAANIFRLMLHAAPRDERGWLALGECHERVGQPHIALELYGAGTVVARPSARCALARARALRTLDRREDAEEALDRALQIALDTEDDELVMLAQRDKERSSS